MVNISGNGISVLITASNTFPNGVTITQFADDTDPVDMTSIQIADSAMGLNGDLITWSVAQKLPMVLGVIPNGEDDKNLSILARANRVGKGKSSAKDVIDVIISYADGTTVTLSGGHISDAMFGKSVASAGRYKSKPYIFNFENIEDNEATNA